MQSHTAIQVLTMDGPALTRDKDVWFEDGNIMVVAQDTGFRIYRGVLAAHSPIFGDMFTMSQPTNAELLDGCPVVRTIHPVQFQQVRYLPFTLKHVYLSIYEQ